ncbi:MAG: beta-aspartyl-peptidase [Gemmatimonadales bacterium]|jgi:beta-aspartyl-dipeptidase (metallo-type)|nr:beta-aspartyl-peptidase [Gemmatimonadales bacterium]
MLQLLRNAELYAPEARGRQHLLVGGGSVLWTGPDEPSLDRSLGVEVVDLAGRRVIPGLIDGHVHLTGGGGEAGYETRVPPVPLSRFTTSGITSVVGLLGTDDVARDTASLVATTRGLEAEGISAWCYTGGYHYPPTTLTGSVRGDMVHIDRVIGVGEVAISDHRSSQLTLDELLKLAGEAHVGGLMTGKAGVVHLHVGDGERGLDLVRRALATSELPARVFNPTHVNRRRGLFDEAMALAGRGVTSDVTAFPVAEGEDAWSAADAVVRWRDAGLPLERLTVSSDAGGCLPVFDEDGRVRHMDVGAPGALAGTLRELLARGLPLEQVVRVFTINVARLLRLPRKGALVTGADADLVVLDDAGAVTDVMARGRWHVRDRIATVRGTFEGAIA